jgi:DNA topoisomerase-3
MVRLIVTEKPSVGRDLARVLDLPRGGAGGMIRGPTLWITWCVGHLVELCEPEAYRPEWKTWSLRLLPMLPETFQLRPKKTSADQWKIVRAALRDRGVKEVINACDAGREGELIFRYAYELSGCKKPVQRLWLSSLTDSAIAAGMASLRPSHAYNALGDAARCRAEADWLVGLNATRALTVGQRGAAGARGPLFTVGRVQTPTLAMLHGREEQIEKFVPEPFWQVLGHFDTALPEGAAGGKGARAAAATKTRATALEVAGASASRYVGTLRQAKGDRFTQESVAKLAAQATAGQPAKVTRVVQRSKPLHPPLLFDLTGLQRLANVRNGFSATHTLEALQALYERHKVLTYPRTDSNYLTSDMQADIHRALRSLQDAPYKEFVAPLLAQQPLPLPPRLINDKEVGDHHAIVPTGRAVRPGMLNPTEAKIFDMVARRFIAAFLPDAVYAHTTVETRVQARPQAAAAAQYTFVSRGTTCTQLGWHAIEPPAKVRKGAVDAVLLPHVVVGQPVHTEKVKVTEGKTQAPPRFTEATLLGAMEGAGALLDEAELRRALKAHGLGTPATRAAIIEALQRRGYLERQGKALVPTPQGRSLIDAMPNASLKSPELTGLWEARLEKVAAGTLSRQQFMAEVRTFTTEVVAAIGQAAPLLQSAGAEPGAATGMGQATGSGAGYARVAGSSAASGSGPARAPGAVGLLCPKCHRGRMICGKQAWGCSRFAQGCNLVVGFITLGHRLTGAHLHDLVKKGRAGPLLRADQNVNEIPAPTAILKLDLNRSPSLYLQG